MSLQRNRGFRQGEVAPDLCLPLDSFFEKIKLISLLTLLLLPIPDHRVEALVALEVEVALEADRVELRDHGELAGRRRRGPRRPRRRIKFN